MTYNIKELEEIMIAQGVALRAIPHVTTSVLEARHSKDYPNGEIKYLPAYKREMLVIKRFPENGGKFLIETNQDTSSTVQFRGKRYFDSIGEAIDFIVNYSALKYRACE